MEELTILRALVSGEPQADEKARAEVWRRLQYPSYRRFVWSPSRRVALVTGFATCAALAATGLAVFTGSVGVQTAEAACSRAGASATPCLHALARLAASSDAPGRIVYQRSLGIGPFLRILPPAVGGPGRSVAGVVRPFRVRDVLTTETWIDRATWHGARKTYDRMEFATAADRAAWRASGSPSWRRMSGSQLSRTSTSHVRDAERLYVMNLTILRRATGAKHPDVALPTDPDGVIRLLRKVAELSGDSVINWPAWVTALPGEDPLLSPAQRAAIFGALPRIPGVRVLGGMRDPLGRSGVAVAIPWRGHGIWLSLYDPRTSRLLADGAVLYNEPRAPAVRQLDDPRRLAHLTWLWTYAVDAGTATRLLERPRRGLAVVSRQEGAR